MLTGLPSIGVLALAVLGLGAMLVLIIVAVGLLLDWDDETNGSPRQ